MKVRYKDEKATNNLANIFNGSSLAIGRTICYHWKLYLRENGIIKISKVLEKYLIFNKF